MKVIQWVASSRDDLRAFPVESRVRAALALWQLQLGRPAPSWKRGPLVTPGLRTLCLARRPRWRRLIVLQSADAVVVLHALESAAQVYPPGDMVELRRRLRHLRPSTVMLSDDEPFAALGFAPADAAPLRLRATLLQELTDLLRTPYSPRAQTAARLGIAPARLSDLRQGKLDRFSLDMLVGLLHRAGADVHLQIQLSRTIPARTTASAP